MATTYAEKLLSPLFTCYRQQKQEREDLFWEEADRKRRKAESKLLKQKQLEAAAEQEKMLLAQKQQMRELEHALELANFVYNQPQLDEAVREEAQQERRRLRRRLLRLL